MRVVAVALALTGCQFPSEGVGSGTGTTGEAADDGVDAGPTSTSGGAGAGPGPAGVDSGMASETSGDGATAVWHAIEIDYGGDEPLSNVPVLVRLRPSELRTDLIAADGSNLRFATLGGEESLAHEYPRPFDKGGETAAWVRVPTLEPGTQIRVEYGDSVVAPQPMPEQVWAQDYVGVWHLEGDPEGAEPQFLDMSPEGHHGRSDSGLAAAHLVDGVVGSGLGPLTGPRVLIDDTEALSPQTEISIEAWVYVDELLDDEFRHAISKGNGYGLQLLGTSAQNPNGWAEPKGFVYATTGGGSWRGVGPTVDLPLGRWVYIAVAFNATLDFEGDGGMRVRTVLASQDLAMITAERDWDEAGVIDDTNAVIRIGGNVPGNVDEVRIANVERPVAWFAVQFRNGIDDLVTVGAAQPLD